MHGLGVVREQIAGFGMTSLHDVEHYFGIIMSVLNADIDEV